MSEEKKSPDGSLLLENNATKDKFYNSRLFVLVIGFILTGILGGILTHNWQKKEFEFKTKLEQKYSEIRARSEAWENLYNKIFDQTSEYIVAVNRIVSMYVYSIINPDQQREIISNFSSVSNKWEKEAVIIRSQLRLLFFQDESQETITTFENEWTELISESETLNRQIADLVTQYRVRDKSPKLTQMYLECQNLSKDFMEKVYGFANHLILVIFPE